MHGSRVVFEKGGYADLLAGIDNQQRQIEVKAQLTLTDMAKPIIAPTCMFWTALRGEDYCTSILKNDPTKWLGPLEITPEGKLSVFE